MNMADRIQALRKAKGVSQEELADKMGVSRQAVSKWESGQSTPDLDKIILLSDLFDVTTDYILKGIEPAADQEQKSKALTSQMLYVASTTFIAIGLFCAFGGWYEKQTMSAVWGSMIIQAVGVAGYGVGQLLSAEKAPFYVNWLDVLGIAFMPISMITGWISVMVFRQGWVSPYPIGIIHTFLFGAVFFTISGISFHFLKKRTK